MWEFLDHVFSQGGFVALTAVASVLIFGGTVLVLWNANQGLHRQLSVKQEAHEKALKAQTDAYLLELTRLYETRLKESRDAHDKAHAEGTATQERVLLHLGKVDATMIKVGGAMDTLVEVVVAGRHGR